MTAPRMRRVTSRKEMEILIDDFITTGFEIITQGENSALLRKKTWGTGGGHLLWAVLTGWFSLGFGNAIYAFVAHQNAEQVMLKIEEG